MHHNGEREKRFIIMLAISRSLISVERSNRIEVMQGGTASRGD